MALAKQQKEFSEKELEQFLANRKAAIETEAAKTAEILGQSRERMGAATAGLAQTFAPDGARLATQQFEPVKRELDIKATEGLELQKLRQRREFFNTNFNFALSRFQQANFDRVKAQEEAMKYALDQDARAFESAQAETGRAETSKKQDLVDRYSQLIAGDRQRAAQEAKDRAFKNALIQTLFGLGTTVGGSLLVKGIGAAGRAGSTLPSGTQQNYDLGGTLPT